MESTIITVIDKNKIWFEADDYGYSPKANREIERIDAGGTLFGISVIANMVATTRIKNARVGLHLNFTEGTPLSSVKDIPTLVDASGRFYSLGIFTLRLLRGMIKPNDMCKEAEAQIQRLSDLRLKVSEITSHQHIHALFPVSQVVVKLCNKYGLTMRCYGSTKTFSFRARIRKTILRLASYVSVFLTCGNFHLPASWNTSALQNCFMSWEAKGSNVWKAILTELPIRVIIHPGLPYDNNRDYVMIMRTITDTKITGISHEKENRKKEMHSSSQPTISGTDHTR